MIRNVATVQIPGCLGHIIALIASTLQEEAIYAKLKVELRIAAELSRFEVAVFLKNPVRSNRCRSTSFHYFPVIRLRLERSVQDLSEDVKSVDRGQELIGFHLSEVGQLFEFSQGLLPKASQGDSGSLPLFSC